MRLITPIDVPPAQDVQREEHRQYLQSHYDTQKRAPTKKQKIT